MSSSSASRAASSRWSARWQSPVFTSVTIKSVKRSTWPEALSTISGVTAGHSTCGGGQAGTTPGGVSTGGVLFRAQQQALAHARLPTGGACTSSTHTPTAHYTQPLHCPTHKHHTTTPIHSYTPAHLEHVLLEDEVVAPGLRHILLHGAAGGAVVVEAGHGSVDLEGGDEEEAALQGVELRAGGRGCGDALDARSEGRRAGGR